MFYMDMKAFLSFNLSQLYQTRHTHAALLHPVAALQEGQMADLFGVSV